jgi:hypothetical protein
MGSFLVNFHVRGATREAVQEALEEVVEGAAWVAGPLADWVSFWDEESSTQNTDRIQEVAQRVSKSLKAVVVAFMVHDSDVLFYWLFDRGKQRDSFNSWPDYFDETADEASPGDCDVFIQYCLPGTDRDELAPLLGSTSGASEDKSAGRQFVFEEERLQKLAKMLGISENAVFADYGNIDPETCEEELGVECIGIGSAGESGRPGPSASMPGWSAESAKQVFAAFGGSAIFDRLIARGASQQEISEAMRELVEIGKSAINGTPESIRELVRSSNVDVKGDQGAVMMRFAAQGGNVKCIRTLAELGADPRRVYPGAGTLLHIALLNPSVELMQTLIDLGIDPQTTNDAGQTPLAALGEHLQRTNLALGQLHGEAAKLWAERIQTWEAAEKFLAGKTK